jgi:hypothetical protein
MKIRKMKINDYEYVRKLYNQLYLSHLNARPDIYLKDVESFNFEYFVEQLNNKNTINLVYEEDKQILAIILAEYKKPSKTPFIRKRKVIFINSSSLILYFITINNLFPKRNKPIVVDLSN